MRKIIRMIIEMVRMMRKVARRIKSGKKPERRVCGLRRGGKL